jgi:hypothetical protein
MPCCARLSRRGSAPKRPTIRSNRAPTSAVRRRPAPAHMSLDS